MHDIIIIIYQTERTVLLKYLKIYIHCLYSITRYDGIKYFTSRFESVGV